MLVVTPAVGDGHAVAAAAASSESPPESAGLDRTAERWCSARVDSLLSFSRYWAACPLPTSSARSGMYCMARKDREVMSKAGGE